MVGITHVRRGNVEGAIALLRRASAVLPTTNWPRRTPSTSQVWSIAAALTALKCRHPSLLSARGVDAAAVDEYQQCAGGTVDGIREVDHHGSADLVAGRTRQRSRHVGLRLDARTARADPLLRVRQISSAIGPTRSQIASPRLAFADEPRKIHHPTGEREGDRPRVASSRTPGTAGGTRTPPRAGAASGRLPQLPSPARHNR